MVDIRRLFGVFTLLESMSSSSEITSFYKQADVFNIRVRLTLARLFLIRLLHTLIALQLWIQSTVFVLIVKLVHFTSIDKKASVWDDLAHDRGKLENGNQMPGSAVELGGRGAKVTWRKSPTLTLAYNEKNLYE